VTNDGNVGQAKTMEPYLASAYGNPDNMMDYLDDRGTYFGDIELDADPFVSCARFIPSTNDQIMCAPITTTRLQDHTGNVTTADSHALDHSATPSVDCLFDTLSDDDPKSTEHGLPLLERVDSTDDDDPSYKSTTADLSNGNTLKQSGMCLTNGTANVLYGIIPAHHCNDTPRMDKTRIQPLLSQKTHAELIDSATIDHPIALGSNLKTPPYDNGPTIYQLADSHQVELGIGANDLVPSTLCIKEDTPSSRGRSNLFIDHRIPLDKSAEDDYQLKAQN